jgi:hypothetical protein
MRKIKFEIHEAIGNIAGSILIEINTKSDCVDFVFLGEMTFIVKVTKCFLFRLDDECIDRFFDPGFDYVVEKNKYDARFIFIRGSRCDKSIIDEDSFSLTFSDGSKIIINFDEMDFEPIELIGMSGSHHENLVFHHVL